MMFSYMLILIRKFVYFHNKLKNFQIKLYYVKLYSCNIINYLDSVIDLKEIPVFKYMLHFMGNKIWSKIETNIIKKSTITIWNIWFQEFNSGQSKHAFMRSINGIIGIHIDHVFSFCWHEERDQKWYIGI